MATGWGVTGGSYPSSGPEIPIGEKTCPVPGPDGSRTPTGPRGDLPHSKQRVLGFPRSIYMISSDYWAAFIDEPEHKS